VVAVSLKSKLLPDQPGAAASKPDTP